MKGGQSRNGGRMRIWLGKYQEQLTHNILYIWYVCEYVKFNIEVYNTVIYNEKRKWRQDQPEPSEVQVTVNVVSDILF